MQGRKERRRLSVERPYKGDYIGFRENFPLKAVVERYGREKLSFGDRGTKYNKSMKGQRCLILLTDQALYVVTVEKNKDKDKLVRQKKPWIYVEQRRVENRAIRGVSMSSLADNLFAVHVSGDVDMYVLYSFSHSFLPLE